VKIIIISGPTASGKTMQSLKLASLFNGEIVNFDSLLFYKEINIENFKNCVLETTKICKNCQIINSIIPDAFPGISLTEIRSWWYNDRQSHWPQTLPALSTDISTDVLEQLKKKQQYSKYFNHYMLKDFMETNSIILFDQYNEFFNKRLSRDGHHYELVTATKFVNEVQTKFKLV
jgi:Cdc6-like AAA superfamily ATPase